MNPKTKQIISEIKELYNKIIIYSEEINETENIAIGKEIISLCEALKQTHNPNFEAEFWQIRVYANVAELTDAKKIIELADYVIANSQDHKQLFEAYDWLTWTYKELLNIENLSLENLENKLIDISKLPKNKRWIADSEFGNTYYQMAMIYRDKQIVEQAAKYYQLAFRHNPNVFLGDEIAYLIENEHPLGYEIFKSLPSDDFIPDLIPLGKEIFKKIQQAQEISFDELFLCYYTMASLEDRKHPKKEIIQFLSVACKKEIDKNASNADPLRFLGWISLWLEKNNSKAFEYYKAYIAHPKASFNSYAIYNYIKLALENDEEIDYSCFKLDTNRPDLIYQLLNILQDKVLDHINNLDDEEKVDDFEKDFFRNKVKQLQDFMLQIGETAFQLFYNYFYNGAGSVYANNKNTFAWLCSYYGALLTDIALEDTDKTPEEIEALFQKAYFVQFTGYYSDPWYEALGAAEYSLIQTTNYSDHIKYSWQWLDEVHKNKYDEQGFIKSKSEILRVYNNIVFAHFELEEYDKVFELFEVCKTYYNQANDNSKIMANHLFGIAKCVFDAYYHLEKHEENLRAIDQFFSTTKASKILPKQAIEIGAAYKVKIYDAQKNFEKALEAYHQLGNNPKDSFAIAIQEDYAYLLNENNAVSYEERQMEFIELAKALDIYDSEFTPALHTQNLHDEAKLSSKIIEIVENIVTQDGDELTVWLDEDMALTLARAVVRAHDDEISDSDITLTFVEKKVSFQFLCAQWKKENSGIRKLFSKQQIQNHPFVMYHYDIEEDTQNTKTYNKCNDEEKRDLEKIWSKLCAMLTDKENINLLRS